jgi:dihydrofolate reductase
MARLIMWNLTTLDGFVEGPGRDISWHNDVWGDELEQLSIEQGKAAGALMFGRITYELMAGYWPTASGEIADFMNALPKIVFSRTLKTSPWNNTQIFNDNVPETVADLGSTLISHDLIDEFRIGVAPILLGNGTPLFKPSNKQHKLKLIDAKVLSVGAVIQRYAPA